MITAHESITKNPKYTYILCIYGLWPPVIGRHTKLGHGHLLSLWKAPEGPDTLEISHDSGFCTESPESPVELGQLIFLAHNIQNTKILSHLRT